MSARLGKFLLPILILGAAAAGVALMMANPITPDRLEVSERLVPVEVMDITHTSEQVVVEAQGTVTAARQVQVRPEVAGRIVKLSASLVPGGRFAAGETLAVIDDRDYRVQLAARRESVARARLVLRQERASQKVAAQEWQLLGGSSAAQEAGDDLVLRIPQIEQAEAALAAAEAALAKAELDLERCTVTAPFNALVLREQVDLGQLVNPQAEVATLVGTDAYWVQVSLPLEHLAWIEIPDRGGSHGSAKRSSATTGSPAAVIHRAGAVEIRRQGRIERLLGDVDPAGRMARLLIVVVDPLNLRDRQGESELPLLLGSYVTVEIRGRTIEDAIVVPRRALREIDAGGGEGLWIMDDDDRLAIRQAEVVWRNENTVVLAGGRQHLRGGERLITSGISTPIEGMKLAIATSEPP